MNEVTSPAERYKDATVGEKPKEGGIGSRYAGYSVVEPDEAQRNHTTEATERALGSGGFGKPTSKHTALDWIGDAARATILGPLGDVIGAQYLSMTNDGVTYKRALQAVRQSRKEKGVSSSATLVGAIIGGGAIYKAGKYAATSLATKNGMVDGMMKWGASDSRVKRVAAAAAAGAGIGGVEEGVRSTLEESVDATGGMAFDGDRIVSNTLLGAMTGAAAAPVIEAGAAGGKWMFDFFRRQDPSSPQAAADASRRVLQAMKRPEDANLDETAARFKSKVMAFEQKHRRKPAAAEIMAPEETAAVADVIRSYNGLDTVAREYGEEGIQRALKELDDAVLEGNVIPSPENIRAQVGDLMNDVIKRNGDTRVAVDEMTMAGLQNRTDIVNTLADLDNEGAKSIKKVLDARQNLDGLSKKMGAALDKSNDAGGRLEIAGFKEDLARMYDELHQAHKKSPEDMDLVDKIHDLKNMTQLREAIEKRASAQRASGRADANYDELASLTQKAKTEIENYAKNGLKIRLGDANNMRQAASDRAYKLRMSDPDAAARARALRDLVAPIGQKEVPEYAQVIKRYNLENIRAEGQDLGMDAARGIKDLDELATQLRVGKSGENRPKQGAPDQKVALLEGAAEGTRRQLQNEIRNTAGSGLKAAERISTSGLTKGGMEQTLGKADTAEIKGVADQVMKSYDGFRVMTKPTSVSELAEERRFMGEVLQGAVFANLGGAGRAAMLNRIMARFSIPRGTARKIVDMLGKPGEMDDAMRILQKKGVRLGPLGAAILAGTGTPDPNED